MASGDQSKQPLISRESGGLQYALRMEDDALEDMIAALGRLGAISKQMHEEIAQQNQEVQDLNDRTSVTTLKFRKVDKKLEELVARS
ncbi:hypothetical protein BVRB_038690, partial [Beta vulgaris subsp. vulgaris]